MLINLSDVLSDQHKTVEETVRLEMEEIRLQSGSCERGAYKGKGTAHQGRDQTDCCDPMRQMPG